MKKGALAGLGLVLLAGLARAETLELASPGGQVVIRLTASEQGTPQYEVRFHGQTVISPSPLGLKLAAEAAPRNPEVAAPVPNTGYIDLPLKDGLRQTVLSRSTSSDAYRLVSGKVSTVLDRYDEMTVQLTETGDAHRRLEVIFRAYDDGAAFRYRLPPQPGMDVVLIRAELTQFNFPSDYNCWGANLGSYGSSHETEFDPVAASRIRPANRFDAPLVCSTGVATTAFALAEADLRNYAGIYFSGRNDGGLGVQVALAPRPDDTKVAVRRSMAPGGVQSPWRVVLLAEHPGRMIESTLLTSLSSPSQLTDTAWIRPGKAAWDWWNGPLVPAPDTAGSNDATMRYFIDFAATAKLEYLLIDEGWYEGVRTDNAAHGDVLHHRPAIDIPALVEYAAKRNVGLWVWLNWQALDPVMEQALALYESWGLRGIKVDFMNRDDQIMVEWYERLFAAAARHHLMVDMHGAYHPTGMIRTWPNFITQEGVLGAEYNKWSRRITAGHNVTLAYTRLLAGPMDYTPGGFNNVTPQQFQPRSIGPQVQTTRAHGLAMYVVYDSPFACVADSPAVYQGQEGTEFLTVVPTSWDETRFVAGDIGKYVVLARRKNKSWYVGAMGDENPRQISIPLDFLDDGAYRAQIYADGAAPIDLAITDRTVRRSEHIELSLAGSGGAVVRLSR